MGRIEAARSCHSRHPGAHSIPLSAVGGPTRRWPDCVRAPVSLTGKPSHAVPMASRPSIASGIAGMMQTRSYGTFDLIELNGDDIRRDPLAVRKARCLSASMCGRRARRRQTSSG